MYQMKLLYIFPILIAFSNSLPYLINRPPYSYEKIVLDVDAGADDALAMQIILKNEKLNHGPPVIAVTCLTGNTNVSNVQINVLRTLQQLKRNDIPVYVGAQQPIFKDGLLFVDNFFGEDGFGDFPYDSSTLAKPRREHAVTALIRLVTSNPGQITLIALGPLTNIALAMKLDPTFFSKLRRLVICGGAVYGIGNIKPGIEFNFGKDPEAVRIVLDETAFDKAVLVPWDTIVRANVSKKWRFEELGTIKSEDIEFINKAESVSGRAKNWHNADSMVAAVTVFPSIIKSMRPLRVSAVVSGEARGGLLADHSHADNITNSNLNVITEVDGEEFKRIMMDLYTRKK